MEIGGRNNWHNPAEAARFDARKVGKTGPVEPMAQGTDTGWLGFWIAVVAINAFGFYLWTSWG